MTNGTATLNNDQTTMKFRIERLSFCKLFSYAAITAEWLENSRPFEYNKASVK
jgi:hypothetical protein